MQTPLRITFRHMANSAALEARVHEHVAHLERFTSDLTSCEVVIAAPAGNHQKGAPFDVRINVTAPEGALHARNPGMADVEHADAHLAVRDAFDVLQRMLGKRAQARQHHRDHASIRRYSEDR